MTLSPLPVTVVRDGWDWLIVWCTVGAAIVSVIAIGLAIRANRIARAAQRAVARERRNVFELDILTRIIEISGTVERGAGPVVEGLLRVLPETDMPGFREKLAEGGVPSNDTLLRFLQEYNDAVDRRLHNGEDDAERPQQPSFRNLFGLLSCGR